VWALLGEIHEAVLQIRDVRAQLQSLARRLGTGAPGKELASAAAAVMHKMAPVEGELIEVQARSSQDMCNYPTKLNSKVAYLADVADSADTPPTSQALEFYAEMRGRAHAQIKHWRDILARDIAALNAQAEKQKLPLVAPAAK
jgi:hypothetical protein